MTFRNNLYAYRLLDLILRPRTVILMYHSIADNIRDPHAVRPDDFAAQMEAIASARIPVIPLQSAVQNRGSGNVIVLTFDDAYRDFLHNAVPVLRKRGFPATVFAPTGLLGGRAVWDTYDTSKPLMDWDELTEVSRCGFTVGSHTVSHARLTDCDSRQIHQELTNSLDALLTRIPNAIRALSYPGGFCGQREMAAVKKAAYTCAVMVTSRRGNYSWTNPYALRRRRWL